ncbi:hypothetical protein CDL12_09057 [Handroanthus impetiginosus]|uniref:Uncharacterized protein n=1 Tax=Handroanthus impetiginosus TaxID=429701 RepID=A0A2G9HL62_9LAMI|nr:hypothetical protein CDL12_09057 [Handroanthus impetiginosus]
MKQNKRMNQVKNNIHKKRSKENQIDKVVSGTQVILIPQTYKYPSQLNVHNKIAKTLVTSSRRTGNSAIQKWQQTNHTSVTLIKGHTTAS